MKLFKAVQCSATAEVKLESSGLLVDCRESLWHLKSMEGVRCVADALQQCPGLLATTVDIFKYVFALLFAVISASYILGMFDGSEAPVKFPCKIPDHLRPEVYASLKQTDEPSIKVHGSTLIGAYAPASGKQLSNIVPVTPKGIDRAINAAAFAQKSWAQTPWSLRRKVLNTLLRLANFFVDSYVWTAIDRMSRHILDNQDTFAYIACLDSGKTRVDASFGEILVTAEKLKWTIKHGEQALR